jgi:hypothetical protein
VGHQFLPGQLKGEIMPRLFVEKLDGTSRIDQDGVAYREPDGLLVLSHEGLTAKPKESEVIIRTVEANVAMVAFDSRGIAPRIHCFKSAEVDRAYPTRKGIRLDTFRIVPRAHVLQ